MSQELFRSKQIEENAKFGELSIEYWDVADLAQYNIVDSTFNTEIAELVKSAFPKMPEWMASIVISDYVFVSGETRNPRKAILVRDNQHDLIAACAYDLLNIKGIGKLVYILHREISKNHQRHGIGTNAISIPILSLEKPDILVTTASQTLSAYSWINIVQKGKVSGYRMVPEFIDKRVQNVSPQDRKTIIKCIKSAYLNRGDIIDSVEAVEKIDEYLVRRQYLFGDLTDHDSWDKNDIITSTLNLESGDGLILALIKK